MVMGHIQIIVAILIWSSLGIFIRGIDLPNITIIFYTSAVSGIIQIALLYFTGQARKNLETLKGVHRPLLILAVPICSFANSFLFFYAFKHTTIANAVLAHYTAPIFVAVMSPILLKEKSHSIIWVAIVLSSVGLWLLLWMPSSNGLPLLDGNERLGIIAGALSGLSYALLILMMRALASHYLSLFITCVQNSMLAVIVSPFTAGPGAILDFLPFLLVVGILHSTIAPIIYVQGFRSVRANEAAILGYLEPVGAAILAYFFLNEVPGGTALFGGGLILLSGYLVIRNRGK